MIYQEIQLFISIINLLLLFGLLTEIRVIERLIKQRDRSDAEIQMKNEIIEELKTEKRQVTMKSYQAAITNRDARIAEITQENESLKAKLIKKNHETSNP